MQMLHYELNLYIVIKTVQYAIRSSIANGFLSFLMVKIWMVKVIDSSLFVKVVGCSLTWFFSDNLGLDNKFSSKKVFHCRRKVLFLFWISYTLQNCIFTLLILAFDQSEKLWISHIKTLFLFFILSLVIFQLELFIRMKKCRRKIQI